MKRIAIITGASSGMGRELVLQLPQWEQFDELCFGDLDYLETTCLENFAQAVRAGYEGYKGTEGYGEAGRFDLQERWSYELYYEALRELCWG